MDFLNPGGSHASHADLGDHCDGPAGKRQDYEPRPRRALPELGEETGEIDKLSLKASDFYTKQVNAIVDRLTSIIEPALIMLVGIVVGIIIIVTYLPIFQFGAALG